MKKDLILTMLFLVICGSGNAQMRLSVMRPASVNLGNDIQVIGIVDRTVPENGWVDLLEGIATGEGIGLDKEARDHAISGILDVMNNSPKYHVANTQVKLITPLVVGSLPKPLPWDQVDQICNEHKCQALLSIEFFDSDFLVTRTEKVEEQKDKNGEVKKVKIYYAEGVATLKIGYRIYNLDQNVILDEYTDQRNQSWSAKGNNPQQALASLMTRKAAINNLSRNSGSLYAKRITPHWITVYRHYYRKPKKNTAFITGVRLAQTNNWEDALKNWEDASKNAKKEKTRKRALFNAALAYEVLGDLETAKVWASDAYATYGLKKARDYVNTLQYRIREEERLKEQMDD